ncbi:hypothetical protein [Empedobacter falsenii]
MKKNIFFLLAIILPLLIGFIIYISFRSETLRMFEWIEYLRIDFIIDIIRKTLNPYKNYLKSSIIFSLPDGLWLFSFVNLILLINYKSKNLIYYLLLPISLSFLPEILQFFNLFSGTFDYFDLLYCIVALMFNYYIYIKIFKKWKKYNL